MMIGQPSRPISDPVRSTPAACAARVPALFSITTLVYFAAQTKQASTGSLQVVPTVSWPGSLYWLKKWPNY